ncbi:type II toxin-antitoxin system RelE/ParE family toxin [Bradyrhizobium sp. SZCCHNPS2010]|uniref:type II toxin-antitoxin system RelE/ParE family toxin n=1 Tax=Bradyrhizobium sp. SZCCHNPS2010 TaxID=3057333 RepID=UPI0029161E2B|nr:type II toxin-antitoxin system RelE/ParE family toxin [Bradyrhizobium sp. SZCCHNPS2010]
MLPVFPTKPTEFVGSAEDDLARFPADVKSVLGFAIYQAQMGLTHPRAKPLRGLKEFKGASVLEVVDDYDGDTYRAVYTVRFAGVVYVLHAFQKKSKSGAKTPKSEIDVIKSRLARAKEHYEEVYAGRRKAV